VALGVFSAPSSVLKRKNWIRPITVTMFFKFVHFLKKTTPHKNISIWRFVKTEETALEVQKQSTLPSPGTSQSKYQHLNSRFV
jgi:hypothetical protein